MLMRAKHPPEQLHLLHGSLFNIKCTSFYCDYHEENNTTDPIVPALAMPENEGGVEDPTTTTAQRRDDANPDHPTRSRPKPTIRDLPHCPRCRDGLLRPGVVWFGEMLPDRVMHDIDRWMSESKTIDLMLVIGTSAKVHPAAGYVELARAKGARVAVINIDPDDANASLDGLRKNDWFFCGDASEVVPRIFEGVIGKPSESETESEKASGSG